MSFIIGTTQNDPGGPMRANLQESEVIRLVLSSFQRQLRRWQPGWLSRLPFKSRRAVAMGYAQQFPTADERGRMSGEMVSAWRLTPETIERMPASFVVPPPDMATARSRGRFEFAYFAFTLQDGSGCGAIAAQFGPRCGHGGRYRIKIEDGVPRVEEEGIWIS